MIVPPLPELLHHVAPSASRLHEHRTGFGPRRVQASEQQLQ